MSFLVFDSVCMQSSSEFRIGVIWWLNRSDLDQRGRGVVKDKGKSIEAMLWELAIPADAVKHRNHTARTSFSRLSASLPVALLGSRREEGSVCRRMDIYVRCACWNV